MKMMAQRTFFGVFFLCAVLLVSITTTAQNDGGKLTLEERINRYRKRVSRAFIEEKARQPGNIKLPSGLVIERVAHGSGIRAPAEDDECKVYYVGSLKNGTIFDKTDESGEPSKFRPNTLIKAWEEALQLMREGDMWRIYAPYELAYGETGAGPLIPGFSPLVFELRLVEIVGGGKGHTVEELDEIFKKLEDTEKDL